MTLFLAALLAQVAGTSTPPTEASRACAGGLIAAAANGPCPFLLFFDSSESEISRDSSATLDKLLAAWKQGGFTRVVVSGHSDLSGPARANLRMSRGRADAVGAWLVERGIPSSAIRIEALGENRPIIPTADGVREPQNRRVEVRLER